MSMLRAVLRFLGLALLCAAPARATWSIVVVDLATGEVAIGIATCLTGFDLRPNAIVVVPGRGVAAAQSFVGPLSLRQLIRTGLLNGDTAAQILQQLAAADPGHQSRQYGITSLVGGEVVFTGTGAGAWAGGLTGQAGTLRYAIQGNVLTGPPVVTAAEQALVTTPGTLGDKLMAAMQAARSFGGDGRCSCSAAAPTSCGAPPPNFVKSAHIGLMIWSRPSDVDAPCTAALGCGAGTYWMDLNVANQTAAAPDAVLQLQALYNTWKQNQVGRPDHYQSSVAMSGTTLRANGVDTLTGTVWLRDAQGNPLGNTLPVTVALRAGSTATGVAFGPVSPQPDGSYTFTMSCNLTSGTAIVDVAANDAFGRVGIWPQPVIQVENLFGACGAGGIDDGAGGTFDALRVQNSAGANRVVEVGYAQPFTLSLSPPPGPPPSFPVGLFALWGYAGAPAQAPLLPLGPGNGSLCFVPAPLAPNAPTVTIADSFGLGGAVFTPGTPWTLAIPGVPALLDVALQGAMIVDPQVTFAATNAVLLRIVALPSPTISSVVPPAPLPGQTATINGTNFASGMIGAVAGTVVPLTVLSSTSAQFVMPVGAPCDAQLQIANLGGSIVAAIVNGTPVITSTPNSSGPAAGGALWFATGQNLAGTTVTFNGAPLSIVSQSQSVILGNTPPGTPGPATVVISNPNGCQTTTTYTYL